MLEDTRSALAPESSGLAFIEDLRRHFVDLRDGTHGGRRPRAEKEELFATTVSLLDPYVVAVLEETNTGLLDDTGETTTTYPIRSADGLAARWTLSWPEQRQAGVPPITVVAWFGASFHHPHVRGGTMGDWPLNAFSDADARRQVPLLRAIVAGDLHNLVFHADYRIVPGVLTAD